MKQEIYLVQDACDNKYLDSNKMWKVRLFDAVWHKTYEEALESANTVRVPVKISKVLVPAE